MRVLLRNHGSNLTGVKSDFYTLLGKLSISFLVLNKVPISQASIASIPVGCSQQSVLRSSFTLHDRNYI